MSSIAGRQFRAQISRYCYPWKKKTSSTTNGTRCFPLRHLYRQSSTLIATRDAVLWLSYSHTALATENETQGGMRTTVGRRALGLVDELVGRWLGKVKVCFPYDLLFMNTSLNLFYGAVKNLTLDSHSQCHTPRTSPTTYPAGHE